MATRHLLPAAVGVGLCAALILPGVRPIFIALSLLLAVIGVALRLRRPLLILGPLGYRVEVAGQVRFTVGWDEVKQVRWDPQGGALYVDCGDPQRNLLLPPPTGYPFRYEGQEAASGAIRARLAPLLCESPLLGQEQRLAQRKKTS